MLPTGSRLIPARSNPMARMSAPPAAWIALITASVTYGSIEFAPSAMPPWMTKMGIADKATPAPSVVASATDAIPSRSALR